MKPTETDYMTLEMGIVGPGEHMAQTRVYRRRSRLHSFRHINDELDCMPLDVLENRKARGAYELG